MKIRIGENGLTGHIVECDILGRQASSRSDDDSMTDTVGILHGPCQCLHATERASHNGSKTVYTQCVRQSGLRIDPIFDSQNREIGAIRLTGLGIDIHRPGRSETRSQIVDSNYKETVCVDRFTGPDHIVPPTGVFRIVDIITGDVM